ncbi:hypothetical protein ACIQPS_09050 [Streptomyces sp. NPDC091290]|uniref:hypothetical protein n=1 Tax=Streptomyces sp. NPDC091290 TaxID=3365990 RepID=UPI00382444C2
MATQRHQPGICFCGNCMTCARINAPTLYGFLGKEPGTTFTQVYAWCQHCANWHRHGDDTNKPGDVLHRYPHCTHRGPYKETGYLITVTNIPLSDVWRQMRRATFEQGLIISDGRTTPAIERLRRQPLPMLLPEHHGGRTV